MAATCEWVDVGDGLRAYYGAPKGSGPHPCVVVYIEAFGVNGHFQKLTQRLADEGFATIRRISMTAKFMRMTISTVPLVS